MRLNRRMVVLIQCPLACAVAAAIPVRHVRYHGFVVTVRCQGVKVQCYIAIYPERRCRSTRVRRRPSRFLRIGLPSIRILVIAVGDCVDAGGFLIWAISSVGQSTCLTRRGSLVRAQHRPPTFEESGHLAYETNYALARQVLSQGWNVVLDSPCRFERILEMGHPGNLWQQSQSSNPWGGQAVPHCDAESTASPHQQRLPQLRPQPQHRP